MNRLTLITALVLIASAALAAGVSATPTPAQTDFFTAVQKGQSQRVMALIAEGMDVNMSIGGMTPLMITRDPEMVTLLARAGADVNAWSELLKQTVLQRAVSSGPPALVRALVEAGADVNLKTEDTGMTALSTAVFSNKIKNIKVLIDAGADPNDGQVLDLPLLTFATLGGKIDMMRALIEGGADINGRNKEGATALMTAVSMRKADATKLLIEAGADVNIRTYPKKGPENKGSNNGRSAMDVAKVRGDSKIEELLKTSGAKVRRKPPEPNANRPNTPGTYSLPCSISGSPPPQGRKFVCSSIDQVADSGVEILTGSRAYFAGKHAVPMQDRCQVDLGQPGFYTIRTTTVSTPWELVCRARLGTTTGAKTWIASIRKKESVTKTSESKIVVKAPDKVVDKEDKEPPSIKIIKPGRDQQFVFERQQPQGQLRIEAEAEIKGDCDDDAVWEVEDIDGSKKVLDPAEPSSFVNIRFEGLPDENSSFGKKKISASACGKSDSISVNVFFPPMAKNHPGKGSGTTPNWFFYWLQGKAGRGFKPEYVTERIATNGSRVVGQYDYTADKVLLTDKMMQTSCAPRVKALGGGEATGIDCFAETVRHETQHQKERWQWWGETNPVALSFFKSREVDLDGDLVPDAVEQKLAGKNCSIWDRKSCDGRPRESLLDVEMNAYWIGWEWPVGWADKEDWSWCGKQWDDVKGCPDERRW